MLVACQVCGEGFEAQRSTARFCGSTCRSRARRSGAGRDQAEPVEVEVCGSPAGTADGSPTRGLKPEDPLVTAVRRELGDKVGSVDGQIALHLAAQVKAATGSAASTLAKELRTVLDRVLRSSLPLVLESDEQPAAPEPETAEVKAARRRREQKAAAAAGES